VTVASVRRATLALTVSAPGRTEVLRPLRVRAPFTGTLTALRVADGDEVSAGEELGAVVARTGAAALAGARAMLEAARTDAERADAQRALDLATGSVVLQPLRALEAGVVVSHSANLGDLLNEGDDILTIAPAGSIAFIAQVVQSDLAQVRPGQRAVVDLAARSAPTPGVVHAILPSASTENLSAPVRIDLTGAAAGVALGLFGTAQITVGERRKVPVVPDASVLRDDVYGTARIAAVTTERRVHWLTVTTGAREGGQVEIVTPSLAPGTTVVVAGQVGLPEGAPVRAQP
jgi:multidrug efflux pump subunit AcrA (membrane-fusion protein)